MSSPRHALTVLALSGKAGAGKDTTADLLVAYARFTKVAFADALRAEIRSAFSIQAQPSILAQHKEVPHEALALRNCMHFGFIGAVALASRACVNAEWLDAPRAPRQILQWWGTEYRRRQDPEYWTKLMTRRARVLWETGTQRVVVTDCRFPNEVQWVTSHGGALWRIERAGLPDSEGNHTSAQPLAATPGAVLRNDGTVEELRNQVLRHWWASDSGLDAGQLVVEVACPV